MKFKKLIILKYSQYYQINIAKILLMPWKYCRVINKIIVLISHYHLKTFLLICDNLFTATLYGRNSSFKLQCIRRF